MLSSAATSSCGAVGRGGHVADHGRVHVARPRAHHQPLQRRQAHRRLDATTAGDRGHRGAVAEVGDDQVDVASGRPSSSAARPDDVLVRACRGSRSGARRGARTTAGHGVAVGVRRQRAVERRVEHGHLRHAGPQPAGDLDAGDVGGVVERSERHQAAQRRHHRRRRRRSARVNASPPWTTRCPTASTPAATELVDHALERGGVVGDLLDGAAQHRSPVVVVDQLVLDRRAAGVEDEDPHHTGR